MTRSPARDFHRVLAAEVVSNFGAMLSRVAIAWLAIYHVHDRTLRQTAVVAPLLARVDGAIRTLGYASTLVGALAGGWMATLLGARSGLIAAAVLLAVAAAVAAVRLARNRTR